MRWEVFHKGHLKVGPADGTGLTLAQTERCVLAAGRGAGQVSLADRASAHLPPAGSTEVAALNHHGDRLGDTLDRPSLGSPA